MAVSERLFADNRGLSDDDVAQLAGDGLMPPPIHGFVIRHGRSVPFTLDIAHSLPAPRRIVPEQWAITALVLASFIGPIMHLLG